MTTIAADSISGAAAADNEVVLVEAEGGDDNDNDCPLFMIGLPRDFTQNASLAALASLLEVPEDSSSRSRRDDAAAQQRSEEDSSTYRISARLQQDVPRTVRSFRTRNPVQPTRGGGKVRSDKKTRALRQQSHHPYSTVVSAAAATARKASSLPPLTVIDRADATTTTTPSSSTVGEAQLFLQMWKL